MNENQKSFFEGLEKEVGDQKEGRDQFHQELHKRNDGLLPMGLQNARVLIIGVGSVGSYMAEKLIRSGIGELTLIDPDIVESHNITRTVYRAADIGKPKVEGLSAHLKAINPWAVIQIKHAKLEDVEKDTLKAHVERAHLIICGADTKTTQALINRIAGFHDKPLIVPGLYKGAEGGEVVISIPAVTPCVQCTVAGRKFTDEAKDIERQTDYGTGRLQGEVALASDIHHVSGAAIKLSLSLLSMMTAGDVRVAASHFLEGALQNRTNYLVMSMTPDYWFFPKLFAQTAGQYAWQAIWIESKSNEDCDICGSQKTKTDPIDEIAPELSNDQFKQTG